MPVANPRYASGTDPMIAAWFGVLKNPVPIPVNAIRTAGSVHDESGRTNRPTTNAAMVVTTPIEVGRRGPTRSLSHPATGASAMVKTGAERNRSPIAEGE